MKGCKILGCEAEGFCIRLRTGLNKTPPHLDIAKQVGAEGVSGKASVTFTVTFEVESVGCALLENPSEAVRQGLVQQA